VTEDEAAPVAVRPDPDPGPGHGAPPGRPALLRARGIVKTFGEGPGAVLALDRVSLELGEHEVLCVVGPSGCGKSTLLKVLAGLVEPDSGEVERLGAPDDPRPANALVFQDHGLFPWMSVLENVAFGLRMAGHGRAESATSARELIARMGLVRFVDRLPHELSIGMRQRVNLARALLVEPQVLLLDEPFAALDAQSRRVLQEELLERVERRRRSVVYVTHDIEEAVTMGDRVLVLSGRPGRILDEVPVPLERPRELDPAAERHPLVTRLVARIWGQLETEVRRGLQATP